MLSRAICWVHFLLVSRTCHGHCMSCATCYKRMSRPFMLFVTYSQRGRSDCVCIIVSLMPPTASLRLIELRLAYRAHSLTGQNCKPPRQVSLPFHSTGYWLLFNTRREQEIIMG